MLFQCYQIFVRLAQGFRARATANRLISRNMNYMVKRFRELRF